MDTKTELKKVCFLLLALSTVISAKNYDLGYTWYSEIYQITVYMENCNRSETMNALLINSLIVTMEPIEDAIYM